MAETEAEPRNEETELPKPVNSDRPSNGIPTRTLRKIDQDDVPHHAVARSSPTRLAKALELSKACARIADDNRAKDILVLDLRPGSPLVDFFVIATATSRRSASAIAVEVDIEMKKIGEKKLGMEGSEEGRWTLIDYGDFVVHLFSEDARSYYALEDIWNDAPRIDWQDPSSVVGELKVRPLRGQKPATDAPAVDEAETAVADETETPAADEAESPVAE
ncbi:ribosome silencing factor [Isosphaeraceae bacterium EP7]